MTTTAFDDQFTVGTQTIERVRQPYDTASILRRNVADLELALRTQTERAEAAEAEMTKARKQKPVRWHVRGNYFHDGDAAILFASMNAVHGAKVEQLYAAPVPVPAAPLVDGSDEYYEYLGALVESHPAGVIRHNSAPVPAPAVPEAWRNFVMQVATPPAVYLDYPKIGAQEPPVKCRHWRCRSCMCAWSENEKERHVENCRYVQARALLQSTPQAPAVPELDPMTRLIVSDPKQPKPPQQATSVPKEWRDKLLSEFPLFDDEGLCQENHHCEWSLQQDRKRLRALLQSAVVTNAAADRRLEGGE